MFHWVCRNEGERFRSFRNRVPPNLDKIKAVMHGRHATGDFSFSPTMGAFGSERRPVDLEEHVGDSNEAEDDEHNEQTEVSAGQKVDHLLGLRRQTLENVEVRVEVQVTEGG